MINDGIFRQPFNSPKYLEFYSYYFQVFLVLGALRLSRTVLDRYPDMLAAHLIARLLPERNTNEWIRILLRQG